MKCRGGVAYSVESNQSSQQGNSGQGAEPRPSVSGRQMFDLQPTANLGPSVSVFSAFDTLLTNNLRPSVSGRPTLDLHTAANIGPSKLGSSMSELHTATAADLGLSVSGHPHVPNHELPEPIPMLEDLGDPIFDNDDFSWMSHRQLNPRLSTGQGESHLFRPAFDFNNQKFGDKMSYQLMIPNDHLDGIAPLKITDDSKEFRNFRRALDFMKDEKQVLILIDTDNIYGIAFRSLRQQLPDNSYIEYHRHKQDEIAAVAWASDLQKSNTMKDPNQKKFLIGDWFSTAGFEAPAVIFITKYDDSANNATFCQRAKAKLVIYHVPKVKIYHYDVSLRCSYMIPPSPSNCQNCGEIMPGGTYSTCLKNKVWTVNDFQEEESTQTDLPRYEQYPPKLNFKDFLKPSQIQQVIEKSSDFQGTKKSEMV